MCLGDATPSKSDMIGATRRAINHTIAMQYLQEIQSNLGQTQDREDIIPHRQIEIRRVLLLPPLNREGYFKLNTVLEHKQSMEPPLGLSYISSYAQKIFPDLEVEVFDPTLAAIKFIRKHQRADLDELWELVFEKMQDFAPDLVGVSCLFHILHRNAHKTVTLAKSLPNSPITVMGGNYPAGMPNQALSDDNLDFVVLSEGEIAFSKLIRALRTGLDFSDTVDGIVFRDDIKQRLDLETIPIRKILNPHGIVSNDAKLIDNLEEFPRPDRRHYDMEFYATNVRHFVDRLENAKTMRIATMTASRGCPFSCTFCASKDFWGNKIRYRDPVEVVSEMRKMIDLHDINTFVFNDDNLLFDSREVIKLCNQMKKENLNIRWFAGGGLQVSALRKEEIVSAVIETGLRQFNLAIESGDRQTLKKIKKPLKDIETAEKVIASIRRFDDVWIQGFFIAGFWFQSLDQIDQSYGYSGALDLDWRGYYNFAPLPGTEDYRQCVERGYIDDISTIEGEYKEDFILLSTENFTAQQISERNYAANLKYNFAGNRNISKNPAQALMDFDYILALHTDHAFALFSRGQALNALGRRPEAMESVQRAQKLAQEKDGMEEGQYVSNIQIVDADVNWTRCFRENGINIAASAESLLNSSINSDAV